MQHPTCTAHPPSDEQTISLDELAARVSLRLLNPQLDPGGSVISALADANRKLAAASDAEGIRYALARQAGLLEMATVGFFNKATAAADVASTEAFARVATRASDALLRTLGALHQMNRDERSA